MPADIPTVQGTLALDLAPRLEPPPVPARLAPEDDDHGFDHGGGRGGTHGGRGDVVPIDRQQRRALEAWSWRYAQAVVEVVAGDRPVSQLLRWTTPAVYADLARRAHLVARAGGHVAGQGRRHRTAVRAQVLGVRTSFVGRDVAETSIHVRYGARSRAIAARFELAGGRWQCAALEFA
ncbi:Rv3235 family protein [uncultured Nocardioides sp.]|uniref:Rv3235 family protein n=1 Tax=uncultured Nocardioides sp. TaxID=198441 RepID=UPI00261FC99F|nr:Rv3235 family protein [uncultured Nocardioides sp.]